MNARRALTARRATSLPYRLMLGGLLSAAASWALAAGPTATPPYKVSVFARSTSAYTQPDSIVQWHDSVIIGFENHVAKDGTDGKSSTLVQFSRTGEVQRTFSVQGHNDGLRIVNGNQLWALQNEDANPNLVVIDLRSGASHLYSFPPTPHQGGYDDMVVKDGQVYISASNPTLDANGNNPFPALVRATLSGNMVVLQTVLNGNATATDIPTGQSVGLILTDPDSMSVDPRGNIVLDSQADSELIFIRDPLGEHQAVGRLSISSSAGPGITLDDTAFAPAARGSLLVTDVGGDAIYRIDAGTFGFEPGVAYSASDTFGLVGTLNLDTGELTPIVTGMVSARGLLFLTGESGD